MAARLTVLFVPLPNGEVRVVVYSATDPDLTDLDAKIGLEIHRRAT